MTNTASPSRWPPRSRSRAATPHPFYKWAAVERPLETPRWNFHKYLIGRDGHIAAVFPTDIEPMDARVVDAIVQGTRSSRTDRNLACVDKSSRDRRRSLGNHIQPRSKSQGGLECLFNRN